MRAAIYKLDSFTTRRFAGNPAAVVPLEQFPDAAATLASAAVLLERLHPTRTRMVFQSASGPLTVERRNAHYVMNFPARTLRRVESDPQLNRVLDAEPIELHRDSLDNYVVLFEQAATVRGLTPDLETRRRDVVPPAR